MFELLGGESI